MGDCLKTNLKAASDLSAAQFRFVTLDSAGRVALTGAGAAADFVLQDKPAAIDRAGLGISHGETKITAGAAIDEGVDLASDSTGRAVTATSNDIVNGRSLEAATGAGSVVRMNFQPTHAKKIN